MKPSEKILLLATIALAGFGSFMAYYSYQPGINYNNVNGYPFLL